MKVMSRKLVEMAGEPSHWCPGCNRLHRINVRNPNESTGAKWHWDGNVDRPTFSPSVNIVGQCHYFVRNGRIEFCDDSLHFLAGKRVEMPDLPDWIIRGKHESE